MMLPLHAGMICPHIVDWSMLLGAVLAYGVFWPAIARQAGNWYPAGLKERDFSGLYGYKARRLVMMPSIFASGCFGPSSCTSPFGSLRCAALCCATRTAQLARLCGV